MKNLKPNPEQAEIIDAYRKQDGQVITINALAGTGKTTTLLFLAKQNPEVYYLAFNSRLLREVKSKLPQQTRASTFHSLAYRSSHPHCPEKSFKEACPKLVSNYILVRDYSERHPERVPREIISQVSEIITRFCHSYDTKISTKNVHPFLLEFRPNEVDDLISIAQEVFDFYSFPQPLLGEGTAAISHDLYLKLFSLCAPQIPSDTILVDEAQDVNPCMLSILDKQIPHKRVVTVGDSYQHIYSFRLALDAMAYIQAKYPDLTKSFSLTSSYRFGPQIAGAANLFLQLLASPWEIKGLGPVGHVDDQAQYLNYLAAGKAFLFRSNAALLSSILEDPDAPIWVIGGTKEMELMMQALAELYGGTQPTWHSEIGIFRSWNEVKSFAETIDGQHLLPVLNFVEKRKGAVNNAIDILREIGRKCTEEAYNPLPKKPQNFAILSTVHRAKGMEFADVVCSSDLSAFLRSLQEKPDSVPAPPKSDRLREAIERNKAEAEFAEVATTYVAVTRAQRNLQTNGLLALARWALNTGRRFDKPEIHLTEPEIHLRTAPARPPENVQAVPPPIAPPAPSPATSRSSVGTKPSRERNKKAPKPAATTTVTSTTKPSREHDGKTPGADAPGHPGPAAPVVAPSADTATPSPSLDAKQLQNPEVLKAFGRLLRGVAQLYGRRGLD